MHRPPHPHPITDHRQVNLVFDDTVNICFPTPFFFFPQVEIASVYSLGIFEECIQDGTLATRILLYTRCRYTDLKVRWDY